ncbi:MAG: site-specific DNA-methyltransferase [Candidatus Omnitrophica bacterium]|nr:site-specific DNA-methyltransferase [Candidatus Omnitrophota bacterium]
MAKDYSELTKEELLGVIQKIDSRKKYGLIWDEEKTKELFEKESEHALPVLKEIKTKEIKIDSEKPNHVFIEGDNYHALSVLNYTHQGKIDVIYIDPPYNTGNKSWKYNNSYVELDDSFKHSKWLSFMSKRLRLAKNLLSEEGIICVTIDDHELPRIWMLMEEIFGEDNHLGTVAIRNNPKGRKTRRKVSLIHEYALFFGKNETSSIKKIPIEIEEKTHNYVQDTDGSWYLAVNLRKQGVDSLAVNIKGKRSDRWYPIYFDPKTKRVSTKEKLPVKIMPIDPNGQERIWRRGKDAIDEMFRAGDLWCKETRNGMQVYFKFRGGLDGEPPESIWYESKYSASEYGTKVLENILGKRESFPYPKSPYAVVECIKVCSNKPDSTILDFFAGSGTTLQAVLELNFEDKGVRKCILCTNNENDIASEVCYPRISNVIKGYKPSKGEKIDGFGGNLKYFKTAFVRKSFSGDDLKSRITHECTEMLCLRESIFDEKKKADDYRIFEQSGRILAVYYSMNRKELKNLKKDLDKMSGEKILYCFTLDPFGLHRHDFDGWDDVALEPIPQKILDIYEGIYEH